MLRLAVLLIALLVSAAGPSVAAEDRFVPGFEDLPLMTGLTPVEGSSVVFDKPHGRIIEAAVTGTVAPPAIEAFYDRTLPQLGWQRFGGMTYAREGERLRIEIGGPPDRPVVGFFLSPN